MYQDTFEEDDLIAEVELVAQARYSSNVEVDDKFDTEGKLTFFFSYHLLILLFIVVSNQTTNTQIPDPVKNFIHQFYRSVMDNNIYELHIIYDTSFNKLTEKYYRKQPWPEAEVIAPLVNDGKWRMTVKHAVSNYKK